MFPKSELNILDSLSDKTNKEWKESKTNPTIMA